MSLMMDFIIRRGQKPKMAGMNMVIAATAMMTSTTRGKQLDGLLLHDHVLRDNRNVWANHLGEEGFPE